MPRRVSRFEAVQVRAEVTPQLRMAIIKRDRGMCRYCTIRPKWQNIEIDHVRPVVSGGKSTMENCVTACRTCNQRKGWSLRWVPVPLDKMPAVPCVDALATGPAKKSKNTAAKQKRQAHQEKKAEKWKARLAERERRLAAGEPLWDCERM
jgi:hypothetical protein